jgi:hypothetical protein
VKINIYASKTGKWIKRGAAIALCAGLGGLLGSCGGSGVSSETGVSVGALSLNPPTGTLYANTPFTFTIAGGRRPYNITTNEPSVVSVPTTLDGNTFTVIPSNPGVVDPGGDANTVPRRSFSITVRDNAGTQISSGASSYAVLQNFITGYGISISSLFSCGASTTGGAVASQACVGSESAIDLRPTTAGVLYRNRALRFSINYGEYLFIDKNSNPPNTAVSAITLTTSGSTTSGGTEGGTLRAFLRPLDSARTQFAGMRITDVQSGVFLDVDFVIQTPTPTALTVLPTEVGPIEGRDSSSCGAGAQDVRISGGVPPYSIRTSQSISAPPQLSAPGAFTVLVGFGTPPGCINEPNGVIVTDSAGQSISIKVSTKVGTTAPIQLLNAFPTAITCLPDNIPGTGTPPTGGTTFTSSVAVTGGNALKVVSSDNPSLVTVNPSTVSGASGTVTLTSAGVGGAAGQAVRVRVTDGSSNVDVSVTRKTTCP